MLNNLFKVISNNVLSKIILIKNRLFKNILSNNIRPTVKIAKFKHKLAGINLIGLIIASGLGVFILGAVIKISLTISTNLQLIKAISELEASARNLENFFTKVILANGYNNNSTPKKENIFYISNNGDGDLQFSLWFTGGISNAVTCSGQPAPVSEVPMSLTIYMNRGLSGPPAYITCVDDLAGITQAASWTAASASSPPGQSNMPLVTRSQIADFYVLLTATSQTPGVTGMKDIPLIRSNASATPSALDPFALKVIVLLRSTDPIFPRRTVDFQLFPGRIYSQQNDGYLYKLVVIHVPFENTKASGTKAKIST